MGTTIHYKGKAKSRDSVEQIIKLSESFASIHNWQFERIHNSGGQTGVSLLPDPNSESVTFLFDEKYIFSGFTKTGFAPSHIHKQITELLFEIKPFVRSFSVADEAGVWDELLESKKKKKVDLRLSILSDAQIKEIDELSNHENRAADHTNEAWFWNHSANYGKLDFRTVREFFRKDIEKHFGKEITLSFVVEYLRENDLHPFLAHRTHQREIEFALCDLGLLWTAIIDKTKPSDKKRDKGQAFSWTISQGCFLWHGGLLSPKHRDAMKLLDQLEGGSDPYITMQFINARMEFFGYQRE